MRPSLSRLRCGTPTRSSQARQKSDGGVSPFFARGALAAIALLRRVYRVSLIWAFWLGRFRWFGRGNGVGVGGFEGVAFAL